MNFRNYRDIIDSCYDETNEKTEKYDIESLLKTIELQEEEIHSLEDKIDDLEDCIVCLKEEIDDLNGQI